MRRYMACCILACFSIAAATKYSDSEVEALFKENEKLRKELRDEAKAANEARNHARSLFNELMKWRG